MVEPVAGLFGAFAVVLAEPILPYALAFAAGAMVYVVMDDIIPEAQIRLDSIPRPHLSLSQLGPHSAMLALSSFAPPFFISSISCARPILAPPPPQLCSLKAKGRRVDRRVGQVGGETGLDPEHVQPASSPSMKQARTFAYPLLPSSLSGFSWGWHEGRGELC